MPRVGVRVSVEIGRIEAIEIGQISVGNFRWTKKEEEKEKKKEENRIEPNTPNVAGQVRG